MQKKVKTKPKQIFSHKIFKIISFILVLSIIFVGSIFIYRQIKQVTLNKVQSTLIPNTVKKILTNPETKIKSIENLQEVSGVYQFILKLETGDKKSNYVLYMTKDGKIIFTSGLEVDKLNNTQSPNTPSISPAIAK